jgi:hypothetical protein
MMKLLKLFCLGLMLVIHQPAVQAGKYNLEPGDAVLTNCHDIYTKGVVKAKVDDGYTVHFPKGSGPIQCPPFRWHAEFVVPFQSVPEYHLKSMGGFKQDLVFKVGESVILHFDTDRRVVNNKASIDINTEITDISGNGAIAVKLSPNNSPEAAATFWQWVGGNYVDLRHKSLDVEKAKRSR